MWFCGAEDAEVTGAGERGVGEAGADELGADAGRIADGEAENGADGHAQKILM